MEDGAPAHRAKATKAVHDLNGIPKFIWPAQSPDLNPIENVWNLLKTRMNKQNPRPTTEEDVRAAIIREWDDVSVQYIRSLVDSMPIRLAAVRAAGGGHTRW